MVFYPECCRGGGSCLLRLLSQTNDPTGKLAVGCKPRHKSPAEDFPLSLAWEREYIREFPQPAWLAAEIGGAMTSCYGLIVTCNDFFID